MDNPCIRSSLVKEDETFELPLRPQSLAEFVGQRQVCERLEVSLGAAKMRGDPLCHSLFCGPPGLGKTTLAHLISKMMGVQLFTTSGPALEKPGDLAGLLTNLKKGDVLFIDEIHRLSKNIEEYLYSAMEDFSLDLVIDSGPNARTVQVKLKPFTLVGATTRQGLLSGPFRSRFGLSCRLDYYPPEDLQKILERSSRILKMNMEAEVAYAIAQRARGTPRIANNLLRWVRDFAQMRYNGIANLQAAREALAMLSIDAEGLDEMDKRILHIIIDHYEGGPVGINTIGVAIGEEGHTLEEVYEPYLIMQGFLKRTPRGREATRRAFEHLGKTLPNHLNYEGEVSL